jgi:hypothetical protein
MMAFLRLNDGKFFTLEKPLREDKLFGYINDDNKLAFSLDDADYIRRHFDLLYKNHLQFVGKVIEAQKQ